HRPNPHLPGRLCGFRPGGDGTTRPAPPVLPRPTRAISRAWGVPARRPRLAAATLSLRFARHLGVRCALGRVPPRSPWCLRRSVGPIAADEGAAYGAAILAGVGARIWPTGDEAVDAIVRRGGTTSPQPDAAAVMKERYAHYRRIYPALRAIAGTAPREENSH